jgi:hypothetical protein
MPETCTPPSPRDAGFTLAEALIALLLTLIVMSAGIETFTSSMSLVGTSRTISETNHGLQAAMSQMTRDLLQTGQGIPTGGVPLPSGTGSTPIVRPGPVAMTFPVAWTALPAMTPGAGLGPTLLSVQTDMITMIYADPVLRLNQFPLDAIAADASTMTVNAGTPITGTGGLAVGDIILFTNASGSALRMITAVSGGQTVTFAAGDPLGLNQDAPQGTLVNLQSSPGVYPPTTATRVQLISYYIDSTTDPTLPRLVRQVNNGQRLAIAMGVENLQISYDLVDGVTNPTNVDTPPVSNSANQIRKVNLFLSARSIDRDPQTRQFFRNSMATDVGLRSLSFVDRYR